jgi:mono/diheme cytochrome c family protein
MRPLTAWPLLGAAALLLVAAGRPQPHAPRPYALPDEAPGTLPPGEGADLTASVCAACHSLDYVTTQPRGKGAQFWKDSVTKMVTVYGAPLSPGDADKIAAYLARAYGDAAR